MLDFLRDVGKHFSVNAMVNKESVKQRLNRDGSGISFTEFSYALLQGMDFAELTGVMIAPCKLVAVTSGATLPLGLISFAVWRKREPSASLIHW